MPNYPYSSGQTAVVQAVAQLRKGFPKKVDAGYLQRFSIAPANESYIISILRFLGLIDEDGSPVEDSTAYFFGNDDTFKPGLEAALRDKYALLFNEMGDSALTAGKDDLTNWFRHADKTSELVGQRQAATFLTLTGLAGHGDVPAVRGTGSRKATAASGETDKKATAKKVPAKKAAKIAADGGASDGGASGNVKVQNGQDVGLTVRIEVNLPPRGDADTYDAIFASIKKHLMS
ncbi:DUF5343 domain-containing protein [Janibacter sp. GS2]|uniref:DUF5343 domain-containing protein n=1 Tax=Janibacter sp. GS2 TaxID=3442646 RepID=UPI003EBA5C9C